MKVLHLIYDLSTAGAQTVVMNYLRFLNNNPNIEQIVLIPESPTNTSYEEEAKIKGFKIVYCNYRSSNCFLIRPLVNWLRYQFLIYKNIKKIKPDILHSHITWFLPYFAIPCLLSGVRPIFHTLHSDPYAFPYIYVIWAKISFRLFRFKPICVTEVQAQKACARYGIKDYYIIKNGIDPNRFKNNLTKSEIRSQIGIEKDAFVIGCVGRFDKVKNHPFLVGLFNEYKKNNKNAILLLIGDGSEKTSIQKLVGDLGLQKDVLFLGQKNDVEKYYYAMDVFMLTSFHESSSIVTVEAQFAGLRCVISDRIPKNVVVTDKVNRLSLEASSSMWISAIEGDVKCDEPIGSLEDFSINKTIADLLSLYNININN